MFGGVIPKRATKGSAGYDLVSQISAVVQPGEVVAFSTGTTWYGSQGLVGLVCSRSGLASKGLQVVNQPGIIDSDFGAELVVRMRNYADAPISIATGDKIAQLVLMRCEFDVPDLVVDSIRTGGFGSTGR